MKREEQKDANGGVTVLAKKCDVIMNGVETIGSAERSCDVDDMRERFYSIMGGQYAKDLFALFGKERTEAELESFFQHTFVPRSGAGIGVTRMIKACKAAKLI
jgi:aspartyl/asparaginyl-tRNA synthetase